MKLSYKEAGTVTASHTRPSSKSEGSKWSGLHDAPLVPKDLPLVLKPRRPRMWVRFEKSGALWVEALVLL